MLLAAMIVSPATFQRLCRARRLIDDDAEGTQTIRVLARQVGLSPFHLIRNFRALFGVTPHQYRTHVRLERARVLLGSGHSVTDACLAIGFSSPGSFSHLFGRHVGVSPSAYRRQPPAKQSAPGCISLMAPLPIP
jgi:AraC-like DNA-binding protein